MRITKYTAKAVDEIVNEIKITYILYRVLGNGTLAKYGQSEDFDKLTHNKWIKKGDQFLVRKRLTILKEEPIFKVNG